jgi:hypothetical protein
MAGMEARSRPEKADDDRGGQTARLRGCEAENAGCTGCTGSAELAGSAGSAGAENWNEMYYSVYCIGLHFDRQWTVDRTLTAAGLNKSNPNVYVYVYERGCAVRGA